jgi:transposase
VDHQPRPGVRPKKRRRDRLIAVAAARSAWAVGYADETWWSRVARPALRAWSEAAPLRLVEQTVAKDDPDPKALACYGLLLRPGNAAPEDIWLRFVAGRPVSALTTQFLAWCCDRLAATGVTTLVLVWDNAGWHTSNEVRRWLREHNRCAHREGGVRLVPCFLPTKSPWLNPIEPKWVHGKRRVLEPARLLTARQLEDRICAAFACPPCDHLAIPKEVA